MVRERANERRKGVVPLSGRGQGPSACWALHLDIHPSLQALVVEKVVARGDHAGSWLPHICWVHADDTLTACGTKRQSSVHGLMIHMAQWEPMMQEMRKPEDAGIEACNQVLPGSRSYRDLQRCEIQDAVPDIGKER